MTDPMETMKDGLAEAMGFVKANEALLARAEAAEARCARLKRVLHKAQTFVVYGQGNPTQLEREIRAALSDTAQQETVKERQDRLTREGWD